MVWDGDVFRILSWKKISICFVLEKKEKRRKGNMICGYIYVRLVSEC